MVRNIIEAWLGRMIGASQWWVFPGKNRAHEKCLKRPETLVANQRKKYAKYGFQKSFGSL